MTISANTPARRTPLQVAEADLLEADDRVDEQTARVLRLEADLGKARAKRQELIRFRDWRAGNPLLDESSDAKVEGIRRRAGALPVVDEEPEVGVVEEPDLADLTDSPAKARLLVTRNIQLAQAHVPGIGEYVTILVDGDEHDGTVADLFDDDGGRVWVDVVVPQIGTLRALLVTPTEKEG